jgi:hypothetical protein
VELSKADDLSVRAVRGLSSCLPATGQMSCWNSVGAAISCAGTGQDGEIRAGAPLGYTDNGDGTIRDNRTGLVWEKLSLDGSIHDVASRGIQNWPQAVEQQVATLNAMAFAGHIDWRLPNVRELASIVNAEKFDPAVSVEFHTNCTDGCTVLTCSCTPPYYYWSSTTYAAAPAYAWTEHFSGVFVDASGKTQVQSMRAVRSDW